MDKVSSASPLAPRDKRAALQVDIIDATGLCLCTFTALLEWLSEHDVEVTVVGLGEEEDGAIWRNRERGLSADQIVG